MKHVIPDLLNLKAEHKGLQAKVAAPTEKTLQNLAGKWKLNGIQSDEFSQVLAMQGVNALLRKAISVASVQLKISQPSKQEIHMEQTATAASIPGTTEEYILDWQWRQNHDAFFGDIEGRSRWISNKDVGASGTDGIWLEGDSEDMLIQAVGKKPDDAWTATHLWGFEEIDGERKHTRRVNVTSKNGETVNVRMVYDYDGD
ncbi:hypothetical protein LTR84_007864 [Exophiala bonariae]|uniref:Uncharacterized protein n=1 Tax=Exophiala bonariae TaxID=1690606 RepID=A0AAV9NNQ4_9EURO|nr:hypothetical protein LTR84_007864 [Exophiala bonariae]